MVKASLELVCGEGSTAEDIANCTKWNWKMDVIREQRTMPEYTGTYKILTSQFTNHNHSSTMAKL